MEFYDKLVLLIEERGITKNKLLTDLNLNRNSFGNWQKQGSKPRAETMERIAEYFNVTAESLSNDNVELEYQPSAKKSFASKLRSYYQRTVSLFGSYDITDEKLGRFSKLLNASITFLTNPSECEFNPEKHSAGGHSGFDYDAIFDILELSDRCVDNDVARTVMIQISRVILYRVSKVKDADGNDFDLYNCKYLLSNKLNFLYTNKPCKDVLLNYGLNFTEISAIHQYTGLSYFYLFTGEEKA